MEYRIFTREDTGKDATWWRCMAVYESHQEAQALKHYARRVKEYGTKNVVFAEVPEMTSVSVSVLYGDDLVNSE